MSTLPKLPCVVVNAAGEERRAETPRDLVNLQARGYSPRPAAAPKPAKPVADAK